jgi:hypothetical protein
LVGQAFPAGARRLPGARSGQLDTRQRLEFLRWHLDHHLQQIEDVASAAGFPPAG